MPCDETDAVTNCATIKETITTTSRNSDAELTSQNNCNLLNENLRLHQHQCPGLENRGQAPTRPVPINTRALNSADAGKS